MLYVCFSCLTLSQSHPKSGDRDHCFKLRGSTSSAQWLRSASSKAGEDAQRFAHCFIPGNFPLPLRAPEQQKLWQVPEEVTPAEEARLLLRNCNFLKGAAKYVNGCHELSPTTFFNCLLLTVTTRTGNCAFNIFPVKNSSHFIQNYLCPTWFKICDLS